MMPNYTLELPKKFKEYVTTSRRLSKRRPDIVKSRKMGHGLGKK